MNEHASKLGKLARGKTSERKKKSSRRNGLLGGRPKKVLGKGKQGGKKNAKHGH